MEITLGDATKLLDNIMANYSQWHTERSSSKKVHAIEDINVLSEKMDELMNMYFVGRNNFGNNAYRGNFNPRPYPSNSSNNYGNSYNNSGLGLRLIG